MQTGVQLRNPFPLAPPDLRFPILAAPPARAGIFFLSPKSKPTRVRLDRFVLIGALGERGKSAGGDASARLEETDGRRLFLS